MKLFLVVEVAFMSLVLSRFLRFDEKREHMCRRNASILHELAKVRALVMNEARDKNAAKNAAW